LLQFRGSEKERFRDPVLPLSWLESYARRRSRRWVPVVQRSRWLPPGRSL